MNHELRIMNYELRIIFLLFFILNSAFLILNSRPARAETVSSDSYKIQMGHLNMSAGIPSSATYKMGLTGGQTSPGLYSSTGYHAHMGFWYVKNQIPFAFTISDLSIDFGTLTVQTPSTLSNTLIVSSGGAGGYQVTARESDLLKTLAGTANIPDTTCGSSACNETTAAPWTSNAYYGFGYNMSGNDIPTTFVNSTYYRPFPSNAASESPAIVMSSNLIGKNRTATVTYKINISGSQAAGDYENYLVFVATPTY